MELITLQSAVWEQLKAQLDAIHNQLKQSKENEIFKSVWLNHHEVCEYLHISPRTLTRMRKAGELTYAENRRQYFYTIGSIQDLLDKRVILSKEDYLINLTTQAKKHLKQ